MINKNLLHTAVEKKAMDQLFFAVVNECFMKSLPIDTSTITPKETKDLQLYTWTVLEALGGINALEAAVDFDKKTLQQNLFLGEIYNVCMESSIAVKKRVDDIVEKDPEMKFQTAVDRTSLTSSEFKQFTKKKEGLNLDKVADIIKRKTINVIKDEQDQYEKEQDLDKELKDAIMLNKDDENPDNSEEDIDMDDTKDIDSVKESLLNIYLDKDSPRHHVSVFSRLQETAMEMMNVVNVRNNKDYMPIVFRTTFESFLRNEDLPNIDQALESAQKIAREEICEVNQSSRPRIATLVSIVVYTMMETLKTMGIFCPNFDNIHKFVSRPIDGHQSVVRDATEFYNKARRVVKESAMTDFSKLSTSKLGDMLVELENATEAAQKYFPENENTMELADFVSETMKYEEDIKNILQQRAYDSKDVATESFNTRRQKSHDLAQFNRMNSLFGKNPNINEIILQVDMDRMPSIIDVNCANESGNIINQSYMNIEYACESANYIDYLKDRFENSKLSATSKNVTILLKDGKGTRINIS